MWFLSKALSEDDNGMVDLRITQRTHTDLNILHPNANKNSELLLNPSLYMSISVTGKLNVDIPNIRKC